ELLLAIKRVQSNGTKKHARRSMSKQIEKNSI
ncbi:MAG: hypothetical protein ACI8RD_005819, partial [Bacillariaceae sp.]